MSSVPVNAQVKLVAWSGNMVVSNRFLHDMFDNPWEPQEPGTVSMPDYIKLSAHGKAKMVNGRVCLLKESTDG